MIGLPRGAGFGRGPGGGVGDGTAREELSVNTFVIIKKLSLSPMYMSCVKFKPVYQHTYTAFLFRLSSTKAQCTNLNLCYLLFRSI